MLTHHSSRLIAMLLLFSMLFSMLLAACGAPASGDAEQSVHTADTADVAEQKPLTLRRGPLRLLVFGMGGDLLKEIIRRYEKNYGEQIIVTALDDLGYRFYAAAISGQYDLVVTDCLSDLLLLAAQNTLLPMNALIGDLLDSGAYLDAYKAGQIAGQQYILTPFFEPCGLMTGQGSPVTDLSSYSAIAAALAAVPEETLRYAMQFYNDACVEWIDLADYVDFQALACDFSGEEWEALLQMADLPLTAARQGPIPEDKRADIPFVLCTPKYFGDFENHDGTPVGEVRVAPMPSRSHDGYGMAGTGYVVPRGADNLGSVRDFLRFLLSDEIQGLDVTDHFGTLYATELEFSNPLNRELCTQVLTNCWKECDVAYGAPIAQEEWMAISLEMAEHTDHYLPRGLLCHPLYDDANRQERPPEQDTNQRMQQTLAQWGVIFKTGDDQ